MNDVTNNAVPVSVINVGADLFADALAEQGIAVEPCGMGATGGRATCVDGVAGRPAGGRGKYGGCGAHVGGTSRYGGYSTGA